jgi:hypothetical protein
VSPLIDDVRRLVDQAAETYRGTDHERTLLATRRRLDEPLRVAIAGKVKAGKSTLLNALVGEPLAPTDAGECTRIVTWYRDSHAAQVVIASGGQERQVPFHRDDGALVVQLDVDPDDVEHMVVSWPSERLREMTLIDTPGIASLSEDVSARTHAFLTPEDGEPSQTDAVLYLMKHFHAADARFLETFHDDEVAQATPLNAVAVLSRADEVGGGRADAMESAREIADRYRSDPRIRRLCQTVVPVAGLVAQSASTLRESEVAALRTLASTAADDVEKLLASADRFVDPAADVDVPAVVRRDLLLRFGVYGVRLATTLLRTGAASTAQELSVAMVERSGLDELRRALASLFGERRDVLKARSALLEVDAIVRAAPVTGSVALESELERIEAGAHELTELRLLNLLRAGAIQLPAADVDAALRLLGGEGAGPRRRLATAPDASDADLRAAAEAALAHWRKRAENPILTSEAVHAATALVRTCEGMLARLP